MYIIIKSLISGTYDYTIGLMRQVPPHNEEEHPEDPLARNFNVDK